ncbi:hypothetical protein P9112_012516 [Eukaryota sp. TZLM1-RC]
MLLHYVLRKLPFIHTSTIQSSSISLSGAVSIPNAQIDVDWLNANAELPLTFLECKADLIHASIVKTNVSIKNLSITACPSPHFFSLFDKIQSKVAEAPGASVHTNSLPSTIATLITNFVSRKLLASSSLSIDSLSLSLRPCIGSTFTKWISLAIDRIAIDRSSDLLAKCHKSLSKSIEVSGLCLKIHDQDVTYPFLTLNSLESCCVLNEAIKDLRLDVTLSNFEVQMTLSDQFDLLMEFLEGEFFSSTSPVSSSKSTSNGRNSVSTPVYLASKFDENLNIEVEKELKNSNYSLDLSITLVEFSFKFGLDIFNLELKIPRFLLNTKSFKSFEISIFELFVLNAKNVLFSVQDLAFTSDEEINRGSLSKISTFLTVEILRSFQVYSNLIQSLFDYALRSRLFNWVNNQSKVKEGQHYQESIESSKFKKFEICVNQISIFLSSPNSLNRNALVLIENLLAKSEILMSSIDLDLSIGLSLENSMCDATLFFSKLPLNIIIETTNEKGSQGILPPKFPPDKIFSKEGPVTAQNFDSAPPKAQFETDLHGIMLQQDFFKNNNNLKIEIYCKDMEISINQFNGSAFSKFLHLINAVLTVDLVIPLKFSWKYYQEIIQSISQSNSSEGQNIEQNTSLNTLISINISSFKFKIGHFYSYLLVNLYPIDLKVCQSTFVNLFGIIQNCQVFSSARFDLFEPSSPSSSCASMCSEISDLDQFVSPPSSPRKPTLSGQNTSSPLIENDGPCFAEVFKIIESFSDQSSTFQPFCTISVSDSNQIRLRLSNLSIVPPELSQFSTLLDSLFHNQGPLQWFTMDGPELTVADVPPANIDLDVIIVDCYACQNATIGSDKCCLSFLIEGSRFILNLSHNDDVELVTVNAILSSLGILLKSCDFLTYDCSESPPNDESNVLAKLVDDSFKIVCSLSGMELSFLALNHGWMVKSLESTSQVYIDSSAESINLIDKIVSQIGSKGSNSTSDDEIFDPPIIEPFNNTPFFNDSKSVPDQSLRSLIQDIPDLIRQESSRLSNSDYTLALSADHSQLSNLIDDCYLLRSRRDHQSKIYKLTENCLAVNIKVHSISICIRGCCGPEVPPLCSLIKGIPFFGNQSFSFDDYIILTVTSPQFRALIPLAPTKTSSIQTLFQCKSIAAQSKISGSAVEIFNLVSPAEDVALSTEVVLSLFEQKQLSLSVNMACMTLKVNSDVVEFFLSFYRSISMSSGSSGSPSSSNPLLISHLKVSSVVLDFSWIPRRNVARGMVKVFSERSFSQLINSFGIYHYHIYFKPFEAFSNIPVQAGLHYSPNSTHVLNLIKSFSLLGRFRTMISDVDDVLELLGKGKSGADSVIAGAFSMIFTIWASLIRLFTRGS